MPITTVTSPPLFSNPDFAQPFILHIDASTKGLGAWFSTKTRN